MVEFIARKIDRLNKGIHSGVTSVRGGARWVARDWHWAGIVPPIGLLVGISQAENISQAAIQAWQSLNPVKPVEKVIDNPQADSIVVPIASPMVEPTALPTPQAPKPESKAGAGPNPPDDDDDDDQTIKDNSDSKDPNAKDIAPLSPKIEPTQVPVKALTKDTKVISAQTVDIVDVDLKKQQELYQKALKEGKDLMPIPVDLGKTGTIEEFQNSTGRHLVIKNLEAGKTYSVRAYAEGKADGFSRKENPKRQYSGFNFFPSGGNGRDYGFIFPADAQIVPKYLTPNNNRDEVKPGEILATFTYNPDSPEQKELEKKLGEGGEGTAIVISFGSKEGTNKKIIDMTDVFITIEERPIKLKQ